MKINKLIRKEIYITTITIILVGITMVSLSYARFFKIDASAPDVVKFGNISLAICQDAQCGKTATHNNIIGKGENGPEKIYPMQDEFGKELPTDEIIGDVTTGKKPKIMPFKFILENNGNYKEKITMFLTPEEDLNFDQEFPNATEEIKTEYREYKALQKFNNPNNDPIKTKENLSNIKLAFGEERSVNPVNPTILTYPTLYENNTKISYKIADGIIMEPGEKKTFNLYAWVTGNATNDVQGTFFVSNLSIKGELLPEVN